MDPILVDVNVHPTKLEVRFSKEKELTALIESIIKEAFKNLTLIPQVTQSKETKEKQKTLQMDAEQFHKDSLHNIDYFEPVLDRKSDVKCDIVTIYDSYLSTTYIRSIS